MDKLQQIARIGKSVMIQAVGIQPNFKTVRNIPIIDESKCSSCDCCVYKAKLKLKTKVTSSPAFLKEYDKLKQLEDRECHWNCPNEAVKLVSKATYNNEANKYTIPNGSKRLSNLQVKQLLLYHFYLSEENNGIVRGLSVKEVASILNCDVKTVNNNNSRLVEQNYIWVTKVDNDVFNILLCGYKNYHLTAREGGSGYLYMTQEFLKELLNINNVNILRLEIRKLITFDNMNIGSEEVKPAKFSHADIKRVLPKYFNYKSILNNIIENQTGIFTNITCDKIIEFKLIDRYNPNRFIDIKSCEYMEKFNELLEEENVFIDDVYKGDLIQMSFQYNFNIVYESVKIVMKTYVSKGKNVENFGGLVREIIRKKIQGNYAS